MGNAKWFGKSLSSPNFCSSMLSKTLMFDKLPSRDRGDGCATGKSQGVGPEAYLNGTSQGPTPEDARKDGHIPGRRRFVEYQG